MTIHKLKTVNPYFQDIWDAKKLFEVRKNDRDFKVGDKLILCEYDQELDTYSYRNIITTITYILDNEYFCKEDTVIMQLSQKMTLIR